MFLFAWLKEKKKKSPSAAFKTAASRVGTRTETSRGGSGAARAVERERCFRSHVCCRLMNWGEWRRNRTN